MTACSMEALINDKNEPMELATMDLNQKTELLTNIMNYLMDLV